MIDYRRDTRIGSDHSRRSVLRRGAATGALLLSGMAALADTGSAQSELRIDVKPQQLNVASNQHIPVALTYTSDAVVPDDPFTLSSYYFGPSTAFSAGSSDAIYPVDPNEVAKPIRLHRVGAPNADGLTLLLLFDVQDIDFSSVSDGPTDMTLLFQKGRPSTVHVSEIVVVKRPDKGSPTL